MAKPAKKKRKTATIKVEKEDQRLGTIAVPVQAEVSLPGTGGVWDELVIEWGCLGLSEEPDRIIERSGNSFMLDPERPITISEEGMHLYFKPPLSGGGTYGFNLLCVYDEAAEARVAPPKEKPEKEAA
jgi:hypothetical protein